LAGDVVSDLLVDEEEGGGDEDDTMMREKAEMVDAVIMN
jgi:hypothetical protein